MDKKSRNFLYKLLLKHSTKQKKQKTAKGQKLQFLNQLVQSFSGRVANVSIIFPGKLVESIFFEFGKITISQEQRVSWMCFY